MLTFIKLGGSLITDKRVERSFRQSTADRLSQEIASAYHANPELQLLVGHGSGSFGHFAAKQYRTAEGVHTLEEWRAFARVANVAAELNYLVAKSLENAGVPVWRIQPSASALSRDGELVEMAAAPILSALNQRLVPLVYGDVSIDEQRGGTIISTEKVFFSLAKHLPVNQVLLLGEVAGVYDANGKIVPEITPANFAEVERALGGSAGVDVTGGMETKVRDMLSLVQLNPQMTIHIMDGTQPGLLEAALYGRTYPGTLIRA
jgi:isopentenyl phosphate kinase